MNPLKSAIGAVRGLFGRQDPAGEADQAETAADALGIDGDQGDQAQEAADVALVRGRYERSRTAKHSMLEIWATCLAFFVGEQWRQWDKQQQRLVQLKKVPSWRVLPVYNQLPGIIDLAAAKLARARELPRCRPDDPEDEEDKDRAKRGTQAIRAWWDRENMDEGEHEMNVTRILLGSAFPHLYWDPERLAKLPIVDPATGRRTATYAPVGDLCYEMLTPLDVFPEPVDRFRDASHITVARVKPLHWFPDTFGEAGKRVKADSAEHETAFNALIPGLAEQNGRNTAGESAGEGSATLLIHYERPSKKHKQGRTFYIAGDVLLVRLDRLPLPHAGLRNPLPVKMVGYRFVPKRLWPKGLIEECLSPQREMNRGLGYMAEILRLFRSPKRFIDRAWKIDKDAITTAPDEVVEGNFTGANPTQFIESPPNLPTWLQAYAGNQREELRHTANQGEISEGGAPTGVTAASAIAQLQAAENQRLSSPALLGKLGLEDLASHALVVFSERYREHRMMTVPGRGQDQETAVISGADLGPLEVVVEMADGVEDSDTYRTEQVMAWMNVSLFEFPLPFQLAVLRGVGADWMADLIEEAQPQIEEAQQAAALEAQAQAQQQQEAALQQEQEAQAAQAGDEQAKAEAELGFKMQSEQVKRQEAQAARQQQAEEAEAQRAHEREMAAAAGVSERERETLRILGAGPRK